jgi:hypothetical protein
LGVSAHRVALVVALLLGSVGALCRADETGSALPDRPALDRELRAILERPDFQRAMRGSSQDPRDVGEWIAEQLRRLFGRLGGLHEANYGLFLIFVVTGTALVLALGAHIAYTIAQAFRRRPAPRREAPPRPESRLSPERLRREADQAATRGEYREAVRLLYLALVRTLQVQALLPRTSSRTNREHLAYLQARPGLLAVVAPFTETFEGKWYGQRAACAEDVQQCREWLAAAEEEAEAR